jgi:hypothetical protein
MYVHTYVCMYIHTYICKRIRDKSVNAFSYLTQTSHIQADAGPQRQVATPAGAHHQPAHHNGRGVPQPSAFPPQSPQPSAFPPQSPQHALPRAQFMHQQLPPGPAHMSPLAAPNTRQPHMSALEHNNDNNHHHHRGLNAHGQHRGQPHHGPNNANNGYNTGLPENHNMNVHMNHNNNNGTHPANLNSLNGPTMTASSGIAGMPARGGRVGRGGRGGPAHGIPASQPPMLAHHAHGGQQKGAVQAPGNAHVSRQLDTNMNAHGDSPGRRGRSMGIRGRGRGTQP